METFWQWHPVLRFLRLFLSLFLCFGVSYFDGMAQAQDFGDVEYVDDLTQEELRELGLEDEERKRPKPPQRSVAPLLEDEELSAFEEEDNSDVFDVSSTGEEEGDFHSARASALEKLLITPIDISRLSPDLRKRWKNRLKPLQKIIYRVLRRRLPLPVLNTYRPYVVGVSLPSFMKVKRYRPLRGALGLVSLRGIGRQMQLQIISSDAETVLAQWSFPFPANPGKKNRKSVVRDVVLKLERTLFFDGFITDIQKNGELQAWVYSPRDLKKGQKLEVLELSPQGFVLQERFHRKAFVRVEGVEGQKIFLSSVGRSLKLPFFTKIRRSVKEEGDLSVFNRGWALSLGLGVSSLETSVGSRLLVLDHDLSPAPAFFLSVQKGAWLGRGSFAIGEDSGSSIYAWQSLLTYSRSWRKLDLFSSSFSLQWSVGGAFDYYMGDVPGRLSWQKFSPLVGGSAMSFVLPRLVQFHQILFGWPVISDPSNEWLSSFSIQYRGEARWMMQDNQSLVGSLGLKRDNGSFSLGEASQWGWELGLSLQRRF